MVAKAFCGVAGCLLMLTSLHANADLLGGSTGRYDMHGLGDVNANAIPLFSVTLSASTDLMKGNALDLVASYRSVGLDQSSKTLQYSELAKEFSVNAPRLKSLDFSQAIREKVEICPEKLIDKFVIDGAVSLNYQW